MWRSFIRHETRRCRWSKFGKKNFLFVYIASIAAPWLVYPRDVNTFRISEDSSPPTRLYICIYILYLYNVYGGLNVHLYMAILPSTIRVYYIIVVVVYCITAARARQNAVRVG